MFVPRIQFTQTKQSQDPTLEWVFVWWGQPPMNKPVGKSVVAQTDGRAGPENDEYSIKAAAKIGQGAQGASWALGCGRLLLLEKVRAGSFRALT